MLYDNLLLGTNIKAYIAGTGDGIVTVAGQPAGRDITLLNANDFAVVYRTASLANGHYLINGIDPSKQYLVMVRDLPPTKGEQRYEPYCYDYVTPATDLSVAEQQALWESWQT